ncbi:MAG: class I SAM-dependent methyltransferase [Rhodospirillaceae bacterium]|nr:class I SAM-dependent methyltransferase [Rhodospirillaceae bacterium]
MLDYKLRQSGRAALDFLSAFGPASAELQKRQHEALTKAGLTDDAKLADDMDERARQIEGTLAEVPAFRASNLMGEWHSDHHAPLAAEAFAEIETELKPTFEKLKHGKTTLTPDPSLTPDKYWLYPIHRTTGGWDGHPHMGFVHGELIQRYIVGKAARPPAAGGVAADIFAQRKQFAEQAPRRDYGKVLEIGCSSGPFTMKLAEVFPKAEIHACDISVAQLEQAQRNGNNLGHAWTLFQADGRKTGKADAMFDLVTSYIVLHELPVDVIGDILRESFRVLKPGGDLMFGDVAPYSAMNKLNAWRTDFLAKFGGEPFWRGSSTMDMVGLMKSIGFVDVKYYGVAPTNYPWVTYGRKP